mmetsp:Transcript_8317/g.21888  ORF Transcript_8317/g.21888 Transcript_8317/m.21888 type:complete len:162 (-) Transcript_8317:28-513(-)
MDCGASRNVESGLALGRLELLSFVDMDVDLRIDHTTSTTADVYRERWDEYMRARTEAEHSAAHTAEDSVHEPELKEVRSADYISSTQTTSRKRPSVGLQTHESWGAHHIEGCLQPHREQRLLVRCADDIAIPLAKRLCATKGSTSSHHVAMPDSVVLKLAN